MAGRNGGGRPSGGSLYAFDAAWLLERRGPLAGADEAGRGALAGPIVAAAAILGEDEVLEVRDSKLLSAPVRERLLGEVLRCARAVSVVAFPAWWIDLHGLGLANREALRRAIALLDSHAGCGLADGNLRLGPEIECLPRADAASATVAAASIVAKVLRDHAMRALADEYGRYGFERNRGYGTLEHRQALAEVGPCRVHRMSYAGVGP
ncbi:MAG TPA: ribonuclease HII [Rubrobacteraceae bacterium]|nr:ribonuclease HII [Rubrobacteraceae bacterium]